MILSGGWLNRKKGPIMKKTIYRNNRNSHKFIEVVRYGCGHYYAVQFMQWGSVVNKLGSRTGRRFRFCKGTLKEILSDYTEVAA